MDVPTARDQHGLLLSLIIPAYNESVRLPRFLDTVRPYLAERYADRYEVIVVDDGSSDHLGELLSRLYGEWPQLRVLRHPVNQGKGAAARTGILAAGGERMLLSDADGATPIAEEAKLGAALDQGADLAAGSRLVADPRVVRRRTWTRALIGRAFATLARRLFALPVVDTQCGFKMFRAEAAKHLFQLAHERGYLFDIEILARAHQQGYRLAEVPICWSDQPGSRLNPWLHGPRIVAGLWRVRHRLKRHRRDYDRGERIANPS
jgi:dolichyl-phosphate beta-glucosyltransferase